MGKQWFKRPVESAGGSQFVASGSTSANLAWHGVNVITSTAASKKFTLNAPVNIGDEVSVICKKATTTLTAWVLLPSGWAFQKSSNSTAATTRKLIFNSGNQVAVLRSISTSRIVVVSNVNSVSVTTS